MLSSNCDSLTGLGNPKLLQTRFAQCVSEKAQFGLILIDVDGLIYFNDRYGHHKVDEKLKQIASIICQTVPNGIDVFRTGGDEFVALLTGLKMADAFSVATEICEAVKQHFSQLPPLERFVWMDDSSCLKIPLPLTVSCGIAFYPEHGVDSATLYQAADEAALRGGKRLYGSVVGIAMNL